MGNTFGGITRPGGGKEDLGNLSLIQVQNEIKTTNSRRGFHPIRENQDQKGGRPVLRGAVRCVKRFGDTRGSM